MNLRKTVTLIAVACIMGGTLYAKTQAAPETTVKAEAKAELPTLLDLSAEWCSACQYQHKILEEFKTKYGQSVNIQYADVTKDEELARKYEIRVIPTLAFLSPKGELLLRHEGVLEEADLLATFSKIGYELKPQN